MTTVMVSGADEYLAERVVREVARRAPGERLAATMRDPGRGPDLGPDVEVRRGEYEDPAGMTEVFRGADRLLVMPAGSSRRDGTSAPVLPVVTAALEAGVGHVLHARPSVSTGMERSPQASHQELADAIHRAGATSTMLRTPIIVDFLAFEVRQAIESGELAAPAGDAAVAPLLRVDLAAAVATTLVDPTGHEDTTYEVTGSDTISWSELADLASERSGHTVAYRAITEAEAEQRWRAAGVWPRQLPVLLGMYRGLREGWSAAPTGDFERLAGRPATPAREAVIAGVDRTAF